MNKHKSFKKYQGKRRFFQSYEMKRIYEKPSVKKKRIKLKI